MEALIEIAQAWGLDLNTLIIGSVLWYTYNTRKDFNKHEAGCAVHRERMYETLKELDDKLGELAERVAKLEGSFENVPCKD